MIEKPTRPRPPAVAASASTALADQDAQLNALGDPTRRAILARLRRGPAAVGELARGFPVSRPAISQHLKVLKQAHLVLDRAAGTRRLYELDPRGFALVRDYLDQFWQTALTAFKTRVESPLLAADGGDETHASGGTTANGVRRTRRPDAPAGGGANTNGARMRKQAG